MKGWWAGSLLTLLLLTGCSRDEIPPLRPVDERQIRILEPASHDGIAQQWDALLRQQWPAAVWVPPGEWQESLRETLSTGHVVVVPDSARVPVEAWGGIEGFLAAGGRALFLGARPFDDPIVRYEAEPIPWSHYLERLAGRAESVPEFSAIQLWTHQQSGGDPRSVVRAARGLPWQGVEVEAPHLDEWDHMALPEPVEAFASRDVAAIALFVRGSSETSRLALRARERDGTEWLYPIPVDLEWRQQIVFNSEWLRVGGRVDDAREKSGIDFSQLEHFSVGLDREWVPQSAGPHRYGVSDIRILPRDALLPALPRLSMPLIQDPAWRTHAEVGEIRALRTAGRWRVRGTGAGLIWQYPVAPTPGESVRWISLFEAGDRGDPASGSVAGIYLQQSDGSPLEQWGWIGLDPSRRTRAALQGLLNECLFQLQRGRRLLAAHINQHWFEPGELFELTVQVAAVPADSPAMRVSAELLNEEGQIIRRVVSQPLEGADAQGIAINLGVVPRVEEGVGDYSIEFGLEEIGGLSRRFDRIRYPVKIAGVRPEPHAEERMRTMAGRLVFGRIPLFIVGTDYDPGLRRVPDEVWLQAEHFPAAQIQTDFARLRAAGFNAITIPYSDREQARQIRFVLDAARQESLWVNLRLPLAWEWSRQSEGIGPHLDAIGFAADRNVISLDITPPMHLPSQDRPIREWEDQLDRAWTDWLEGQAMGIAEARSRWGDALRFTETQARFPDRADLQVLPADASLWPLLHRFVADWWSHELGRAARQIRSAGYAALLTARWDARQADLRQLQPGQIPFLAEAARIHIDYLTVVPSRLIGGRADRGEDVFKAAYARGVVFGKPVVWGPLSAPVGRKPRYADYSLQESRVNAFYQLAMRTQTSGGWIGQYRPISRYAWDADEGVIDALERRRPAARALRQVVNQLRGYRMPPLQWAGREMQQPAGPSAWAVLHSHWMPVYAEEVEDRRVAEIRPEAFRAWSLDTPADRLADLPRAPFVHMNAEWGAIQIDGQQQIGRVPGEVVRMHPRQVLRAEWINRGVARWSASQHQQEGTVWIEIQRLGRAPQFQEVRTVAPGEQVTIEWSPVDPGTYILRGVWWERGGFGDVLTVAVEESILDTSD